MFGPSPSVSGPPVAPNSKMRWVKSQYSASVSPLCANTGVPFSTSAAAAWSWVEKMLHEAQRTLAPSACSVSTSTAVWIVMWMLPVMRAPLSGCALRELLADGHQTGHFGFGDLDFLAAPGGERQVGNRRNRGWDLRTAFMSGSRN